MSSVAWSMHLIKSPHGTIASSVGWDSRGQLMMPARALRGHETDAPNLARAKLAGELIPVPPDYICGLRSGYKGACLHRRLRPAPPMTCV
jgi:hypothetical protein